MSAILEKSAGALLEQIREPRTPYLSPVRFAKLAGDPMTALAEFGQGTTIVPPGTLVAYQMAIAEIVELAAAQVSDAGCNWKYPSRIAGSDPPS